VWLLLVLGAMLITLLLRLVRVRQWWVYVLLGGLPSWFGLVKASLHPALALVFIIPMLPDHNQPRVPLRTLVRSCCPQWLSPAPPRSPAASMVAADAPPSQNPSTADGGVKSPTSSTANGGVKSPRVSTADGGVKSPRSSTADGSEPEHEHDADAPLHAFEHDMKLIIDMGMFAFTLSNAGVEVGNVGPLTAVIFGALVIGKVICITGLVLLASAVGLTPLPTVMKPADVSMVSAMASIGLTVALFISGSAFKQPQLQAEAKMGALLSGLMGVVCIGFSRTPLWHGRVKRAAGGGGGVSSPDALAIDIDDEDEQEDFDDVANIVEAALESTYLRSQAIRKEILAGRRTDRTSGFSPPASVRSGRGRNSSGRPSANMEPASQPGTPGRPPPVRLFAAFQPTMGLGKSASGSWAGRSPGSRSRSPSIDGGSPGLSQVL